MMSRKAVASLPKQVGEHKKRNTPVNKGYRNNSSAQPKTISSKNLQWKDTRPGSPIIKKLMDEI